jgi:hypothetical protein
MISIVLFLFCLLSSPLFSICQSTVPTPVSPPSSCLSPVSFSPASLAAVLFPTVPAPPFCRGYELSPFSRFCLQPGAAVPMAFQVENNAKESVKLEDYTLKMRTNTTSFAVTIFRTETPVLQPGAKAIFQGVFTVPLSPEALGIQEFQAFITRSNGNQDTIGAPAEADSACSTGATITSLKIPIEITCSDQLLCNGLEYLAPLPESPAAAPQYQCYTAAQPACQDTDPCTIDTCDEQTGMCQHEFNAQSADCQALGIEAVRCSGERCVPKCLPAPIPGPQPADCSPDGCGGVCGVCPANSGCQNARHTCLPFSALENSCESPIELTGPNEIIQPGKIIERKVTIDLATGVNQGNISNSIVLVHHSS